MRGVDVCVYVCDCVCVCVCVCACVFVCVYVQMYWFVSPEGRPGMSDVFPPVWNLRAVI